VTVRAIDVVSQQRGIAMKTIETLNRAWNQPVYRVSRKKIALMTVRTEFRDVKRWTHSARVKPWTGCDTFPDSAIRLPAAGRIRLNLVF